MADQQPKNALRELLGAGAQIAISSVVTKVATHPRLIEALASAMADDEEGPAQWTQRPDDQRRLWRARARSALNALQRIFTG